MVSKLLVEDIENSIGKIIVFFIGSLRFEGKLLDFDGEYLKYYDSKKSKIKYKKISEISEWEVKNDN